MKYLFFILLFFSVGFVNAQHRLTGKITDDKSQVLPYASVYLTYSKVGGASNESGDFLLDIPARRVFRLVDTLTVSYVGYKTTKVPIFFKGGNAKCNVSLQPLAVSIAEVVVHREYTPEEIIENVFKRIKKNYNRKQVSMDGFYRELVKEDDRWIELNEAFIKLSYAQYPQKGFVKKSWRKYWDDGYTLSYPFTLGNVFRESQFFPYYTSQDDKAKIVSSRISFNNSKYGNEPTPFGGPLDLAAIDKVKYQYDFLDPKLTAKYCYKIEGKEYYNNEWCYIIRFYPNESYLKRINHRWDKKFIHAIYTGKMYVTTETFAVIYFECLFSSNADFSYYNKVLYNMDYVKLISSYKKCNDYWVLNEVNTEQRGTVQQNQRSIRYVCVKTLSLSDPKAEDGAFNEDEILPFNHSATLRYFNGSYSKNVWKSYQDSSYYTPLPLAVKNDLEKELPLEKQFASWSLPVDSLKPPHPQEIAETYTYPFDTITDSFSWLSRKEDPAVLNYLNEENVYSNSIVRKLHVHRKQFYSRYFDVFKRDTIQSVDVIDGCNYLRDLDEDGHFWLCRLLSDSLREKVFDYTLASKGKMNFSIENMRFNQNKLLAYTYCQGGDISNTLIVKTEREGITLDSIGGVKIFLWLNDTTILYTKVDSVERSYQLRALLIGTGKSVDRLIYDEADKRFDVSVKKSTSGEYVFLIAESLDESECYLLDVNDKNLIPQLISQRESNHRYTVDHFSGKTFYAITNRHGKENELVGFSLDSLSPVHWQSVYRSRNAIDDFVVTNRFFAVKEYVNSGLSLKYIDKKTSNVNTFPLPDNSCMFDFVKHSKDTIANKLQVEYESPITPYTQLRLDLDSITTTLLQQDSLSNSFVKGNYVVETVWVLADDNAKIPVTLLYNKAAIKERMNGVLLNSYGAYGAKYYPAFSLENILYANKGFVVAFAHVRGGGELGSGWYTEGKLLNKVNTFTDFVSCAKFLKNKYSLSSTQMVGRGLSAGGLIMGYVANNYPDLFGTLIFDRPYLDVVNTMTNNHLPLTSVEYKEWGDPSDSLSYAYIKSYSPYQNIRIQEYPNMLFFSKYNDMQAPYWQIAKSVAMYRCKNKSNALIMLNTDMSSGHRGSVNWDVKIDEMAAQYAFIMHIVD